VIVHQGGLAGSICMMTIVPHHPPPAFEGASHHASHHDPLCIGKPSSKAVLFHGLPPRHLACLRLSVEAPSQTFTGCWGKRECSTTTASLSCLLFHLVVLVSVTTLGSWLPRGRL
jgi:hypothetical protein